MVVLAVDLMGWAGGLMVAVAYVMVSLRRLAPDSALFQLLNVAGAAALGVSCVADGALPPACLNALWLVFGVRSLVVGGLRGRAEARAAGRAAFCGAT